MKKRLLCLAIFSLITTSYHPHNAAQSNHSFQELQPLQDLNWMIPNYYIPRTIHVVGLGDSLTEGVGDEQQQAGYFGRMTKRMEQWKGVQSIIAVNLAKKGLRSEQLLEQLEEKETQEKIRHADVIYVTIGGNDMMKVVKDNLFHLQLQPFYEELAHFEQRLDTFYKRIRALNEDAILLFLGLYNPFSIVTDEANEFDDIVHDWNQTIQSFAIRDEKACFIPIIDLFEQYEQMVYHSDFFHPNAAGYEMITERYIEQLKMCQFAEKTEWKIDLRE